MDAVRQQIIKLLKNGHAHMPLAEVVKDFPMDKINDKAPNLTYSFYDLLYHIYFTQHDILEYVTNDSYKEVTWPDAYWPKKGHIATKNDWEITCNSFDEDLEKLVKIAKTDNLERKMPNKAPLIKELLMVADHNAYHIGELGILRQITKTWGKNHK